jgi:hypothetical protein|tara:strand:+ start:251 stop:493 length:243 start_codon:yes stop_codon:yes gene_type:complete
MTRLNLYQRLNPEVKSALLENNEKYKASVQLIIAKLESTTFYSDLTIGEVANVVLFGHVETIRWGTWAWRYGDELFIKDE